MLRTHHLRDVSVPENSLHAEASGVHRHRRNLLLHYIRGSRSYLRGRSC